MSKKKQRYTLSRLRWIFRTEGGCEIHEAEAPYGIFKIIRCKNDSDEWGKWRWFLDGRSYTLLSERVDSVKQGMNECNAKHREMMMPHLTPVTN